MLESVQRSKLHGQFQKPIGNLPLRSWLPFLPTIAVIPLPLKRHGVKLGQVFSMLLMPALQQISRKQLPLSQSKT